DRHGQHGHCHYSVTSSVLLDPSGGQRVKYRSETIPLPGPSREVGQGCMAKDEPPTDKHGDAPGTNPHLSRAGVGRLSLYLRCLEGLLRDGVAKVSSGQLGDALGLADTQVRKDLASLGNLGHPGVGYATRELITAIRRALGVDREWRVAVVGVGNLARA